VDDSGWTDPAGFHLIPLPFADEIRTAPIEEGFRGGSYSKTTIVILKRLLLVSEKASEDLKDLARAWIDKISVKNGTYPPDSYPNPGMVSLNGA